MSTGVCAALPPAPELLADWLLLSPLDELTELWSPPVLPLAPPLPPAPLEEPLPPQLDSAQKDKVIIAAPTERARGAKAALKNVRSVVFIIPRVDELCERQRPHHLEYPHSALRRHVVVERLSGSDLQGIEICFEGVEVGLSEVLYLAHLSGRSYEEVASDETRAG